MTIFGYEYMWKQFLQLLFSATMHWQGQCVSCMDRRAGHFLSPSAVHQCPKEKKKEKVKYFSDCFFSDIFQALINRKNESVFGFTELSQEKPFTLISDNVQIAARLQRNGKLPQIKIMSWKWVHGQGNC